MVLYFLLDVPSDRPLEFVSAFLPRLRRAWDVFDLVQIRAKAVPAASYARVVREVRRQIVEEVGERTRFERSAGGLARTDGGGRPLVLANDRLDVALVSGADGLHLGARDIPPEDVRRSSLPDPFVVGLTCHTAGELREASDRGVDYVGLGSFFPSPTKPGPLPDPRKALQDLPPEYPVPIYAIGGIDPSRVSEVTANPLVRGIVVSSAIQSSADPAETAKALRGCLTRLARGRPAL